VSAGAPGTAGGPGPLVTVVEDDPAIAEGLALNLRLQGYRTEAIGDGETARTRIEETGPDLVLLDISLPRRSGVWVLERLREAGNQVPVIVLSARQDEFDKVAALRLGADDYVTKPFALAELLARVAAVLRRSRLATSLPRIATPIDGDGKAGERTDDRREEGAGDQPGPRPGDRVQETRGAKTQEKWEEKREEKRDEKREEKRDDRLEERLDDKSDRKAGARNEATGDAEGEGRSVEPGDRAATELRFGDVVVDLDTRTVTRAGELVRLTHLEFELLSFFCRSRSRVFSREELVRQVWGSRHAGQARTVDNFVAQLRAKLEPDPDRPKNFLTVRGSGYRFVAD
jgi:DNA-binding response OmpR family regulator